MSDRKYYYSKLSEYDKHICNKAIDGIRKFEKKIVFHTTISNSSFTNVFNVIQKDFPDIFYLDVSNTRMITTGLFSTIQLSYLYPRSVMVSYQNQIESILDSFITPKILMQSKIEREKYIYDTLLRSVKYATSLSEIENYSVVGPLLNHIGVCQGYSKSFQLLCEKADLLCLSVFGISTQPSSSVDRGHVWNIVQLSSKLRCQVDVTWDSCIFHSGSLDYHQYFNISDSQMSLDHSWDRKAVPRTIM